MIKYYFILIINIALCSEWIDLGSSTPVAYNKKILNSESNNIQIEFSLYGYYQTLVETSRGPGYIIDVVNGASILEEGSPDLDKITASIVIPNQSKMNYRIISADYIDIPDINIVPSKGNLTRDVNPQMISHKWGDTYENKFYPDTIAELSKPYIIRDLRGQTVLIYPFQYNDYQKILRVYTNIIIEIYEDGHSNINILEEIEPFSSISNEYHNIYSNHFLNYNPPNSRFDYILDQNKMLIITYDDFANEMEPFVDWKNKKGIHTEIVNVSEIGSNSDNIKDFVNQYWEQNNQLGYLLLVGDAAQVPTPIINGASADPSYGYLEGDDSYSEIIVGRFSANNPSQVITQVNRTLEYEKQPSENYFTNALGIASNQGPGFNGYSDDQFNDFLWDEVLSQFTYENYEGIYDGSGSVEQAVTKINEGVGIINYTGHAGANGWGNGAPLNSTDVNNLTNNMKYPFIFTVGCNPGEFNNYTECFCESWLWATNDGEPVGAVGHFGSTISQSWEPPMHGQYAMNLILTESYENNITRSYGGITTNGCMYMNDAQGGSGINETNHWTLFGDPSLQIRTDNPIELTAIHSETIVMGSNEFNISVNIDEGIAAISQNGELLISTSANNGNIQFNNLSELELLPGTYDLVITSFNTYPYEAEINVVSAQGAYLIYNDYELESGNLNYGESSTVYISIENVGIDNVVDANGIIFTENPYVILDDNTLAFGNIESGNISQSNDTFSFTLLNSIPDGEAIQFNMSIDNNWETSFTVYANAPMLIAENPIIIDENGDGIWDPGESVSLTVDLMNYGSADFPNYPGASLTTNSEFVTLINGNDGENIFFAISAGQGYEGEFSLISDENTPYGTNILLNINWGYGFECNSEDCIVEYNLNIPLTIGLATNEDADLPINVTANYQETSNNILVEWEAPIQCPDGQFSDCNGSCYDVFYQSFIGDDICDTGEFWGPNFACEEFNFDEGDCDDNNANPNCGDGFCNEELGEDENSCPEDCFISPAGSCLNACGNFSETCYCDTLCIDLADCCNDICEYCSDIDSTYCDESFANINTLNSTIIYNRAHDQDGLRLPLQNNNTENREQPLGYNIFRNDEFIDFVENTFYLDNNIYSGTFCYSLTTVYQDYQSSYTNPECITVQLETEPTGDLNNDNTLNILDVIIMVNMVLGSDAPDIIIGDLDLDGIITVLDIIILINIILET